MIVWPLQYLDPSLELEHQSSSGNLQYLQALQRQCKYIKEVQSGGKNNFMYDKILIRCLALIRNIGYKNMMIVAKSVALLWTGMAPTIMTQNLDQLDSPIANFGTTIYFVFAANVVMSFLLMTASRTYVTSLSIINKAANNAINLNPLLKLQTPKLIYGYREVTVPKSALMKVQGQPLVSHKIAPFYLDQAPYLIEARCA